jgi:hypothetical protein
MSDGGVGSNEAHEEAPPGGRVRSGVQKMPKFNMRVFNGISRSVLLIPLGVCTQYSSRGLYPLFLNPHPEPLTINPEG